MCNLWIEKLLTLINLAEKRLAIVGIGHELRGDDALGVFVVRGLQRQIGQGDNLLILDAGVAPENITGRLRRFAPTLVLLVDAVDMGHDAGTVSMIDLKSRFVEHYPSTHSISLAMFASYLQSELTCDLYLLGVQVQHTILGEPMSRPVQVAVNHIVNAISELRERNKSMTTKALERLWKNYPESHLHCAVTKAGQQSYRITTSLIASDGKQIARVEHYGSGDLDVLKEESFEKLVEALNETRTS